jgi:hypothetical protein
MSASVPGKSFGKSMIAGPLYSKRTHFVISPRGPLNAFLGRIGHVGGGKVDDPGGGPVELPDQWTRIAPITRGDSVALLVAAKDSNCNL